MKPKMSEPRTQHVSWPDLLVVLGGLIMVPVAIFERNWFFLGLGIAILLSIVVRVWLTTWLEQRANESAKASTDHDEDGEAGLGGEAKD